MLVSWYAELMQAAVGDPGGSHQVHQHWPEYCCPASMLTVAAAALLCPCYVCVPAPCQACYRYEPRASTCGVFSAAGCCEVCEAKSKLLPLHCVQQDNSSKSRSGVPVSWLCWLDAVRSCSAATGWHKNPQQMQAKKREQHQQAGQHGATAWQRRR
jgi:hypothetical protein